MCKLQVPVFDPNYGDIYLALTVTSILIGLDRPYTGLGVDLQVTGLGVDLQVTKIP